MLSVWPDAVLKALVCSIHVTLMVLCVAWEMISCLLHPALITLFLSFPFLLLLPLLQCVFWVLGV